MGLKDRIKTNMALAGIIGAIILVVFLMVISNLIDRSVRPSSRLEGPGGENSSEGSTGRNGDRPYTVTGGTLKLVRVNPANMPRAVLDTFEIVTFEFSGPVAPETLFVDVSPPIELRTLHNGDFPNRISIVPDGTGWEPGTRYKVTIHALESITGENLAETVEYEYYNMPPDVSHEIPPL